MPLVLYVLFMHNQQLIENTMQRTELGDLEAGMRDFNGKRRILQVKWHGTEYGMLDDCLILGLKADASTKEDQGLCENTIPQRSE